VDTQSPTFPKPNVKHHPCVGTAAGGPGRGAAPEPGSAQPLGPSARSLHRPERGPAVNDDELVMGTVLVALPARHLLIMSEARVRLIESDALPPWRPSADLPRWRYLRPPRLAVVLTGKGHDAQAGIRAVCHRGGTVLAGSRVRRPNT
jgi:hypothetical protein